jgi:universal stress protein A
MTARIERILVPVDFSPCSDAALSYATFLAARFGASIDVLHVWEPPARVEPWLPEEVDRVMQESRDTLRAELGRLVEPFRKHARLCDRLVADSPVQGILREAEAGHYDVIVIGTHGRTGLTRVLLGSVAEAVLRRAPCPVVTVRLPARAAA